MTTTPIAKRKHIAIFGNTNAGKSALFNAILKQDIALVSAERGTTADPVIKAAELLPYGPITLIDTAGLDDTTLLGELRIAKTKSILERTDFAIYAADINEFSPQHYKEMRDLFNQRDIPFILVFTKCDLASHDSISALSKMYKNSITVSNLDQHSVDNLISKLSSALLETLHDEQSLLFGMVSPGDTILCVTPVDLEAPVGRLILPQVQLIRDALDSDCVCVVTKENTLGKALSENSNISLVVTDSQAFKVVADTIPPELPLTSFSMLFARQKGDLDLFIEGAKAIKNLKDGDTVLIAEACTHTVNHEDIGQIKIPAAIKSITGKQINFEYCVHHDFPEDLSRFALIIHCGGCLINKKAIQNRILAAKSAAVPMSNYGVVLAYCNGILDRVIKPFLK